MSVDGNYSLWQVGATSLSAAGKPFGVSVADAAEIVQAVREQIVEAFESASAAVEKSNQGTQVIADSLLSGLRKLPLVL
jgi:hypothetical protein